MLKEMLEVLAPEGRITFSPQPASIQSGKKYSVASFPWLTWQLNAIRKNCDAVTIGAEIGAFLLDGTFKTD